MIPLLQTDLPPSNLPYLISAFVVTGVVFLGYIYLHLPPTAGDAGRDNPPPQHDGRRRKRRERATMTRRTGSFQLPEKLFLRG